MFGIFKKKTVPNEEPKKEQHAPLDAFNDQSTTVSKIRRTDAYWTLPYKSVQSLSSYKEQIDLFMQKLCKGEIDAENGDCLDALIADMARKAYCQLIKEYTTHCQVIYNIHARYCADLKEIEYKIERDSEYEKELIERIDELNRIMKANKFSPKHRRIEHDE